MISQQLIHRIFYYYADRLNSSSIVRRLFKNSDFVWQRLNLSPIAEVDRLLLTWKTVDKLMPSCGTNFRGELKKLAAEKEKKVLQFVYKIERM